MSSPVVPLSSMSGLADWTVIVVGSSRTVSAVTVPWKTSHPALETSTNPSGA